MRHVLLLPIPGGLANGSLLLFRSILSVGHLLALPDLIEEQHSSHWECTSLLMIPSALLALLPLMAIVVLEDLHRV